jgi:hypothetical protein
MLTRIKLAELVSRSGIQCRVAYSHIPYRTLTAMHSDEEEFKHCVHRDLTLRMASDYAHEVMKALPLETLMDAEGLAARVIGYVLTQRQMIDLLEQAYEEGRRDRPLMTLNGG